MIHELVIRHVGRGDRCNGCGRLRETTRYTIRKKDQMLQQFNLCDGCQDGGYSIQFDVPQMDGRTAGAVRRRQMRVSRKLEKELAHDVGGRTTPGSGNQDTKHDVRKVGEWRLEHKYTDSVSGYRMLVRDLRSVVAHGNLAGEWPGLVVNFRKLGRKFVTIPYELFLEMVDKVRVTLDNDRRSR